MSTNANPTPHMPEPIRFIPSSPGSKKSMYLDPVSVKGRERQTTEKRAHRATLKAWVTLLTNRNMTLITLAYFTMGYFEYIFFYWIHPMSNHQANCV